MDYCFTIDKFSGPLDLLLHLIKQSNISIYEIKIEEITEQYLNYIKCMEQLNLNIASSYLVMAAELIEMKASYLLPRKEEVSDDYEEDPKENLIKRLVEYQNYKDITSKFHELELERQDYFTKLPSDLENYELSSGLNEEIGLDNLINAFEKFLKRKEEQKPLNTKITTKEYSITKRTKEILQIIKDKKKTKFSELFEVRNRSYVIVTFLSILVLAKNKEIVIKQDSNFEDIFLIGVNL